MPVLKLLLSLNKIIIFDYRFIPGNPMRKIVLGLSLLSAFTGAFAQTGHDIRVNFKNAKDTVMYLAFYQFDKSYIADTCKKVVKGNAVFKGKNSLEKGVYYVVSQEKGRYFDFFISDKNQNITITTDTNQMVKNLRSPSSKENNDFFDYIRFITNKNKEFGELRGKTKGLSTKDSTAFVNEKAKEINAAVTDFEKSFVEGHKGMFVADVINLKMEKEAKDIPKASNGRPDSIFIYNYYKNHYWDGVNFQDDGILRTPFFADRVKKYFNNIIQQGLPTNWTISLTIPLFKSGDVNNPSNYRTIMINPLFAKLFGSMLENKINKWAEERDKHAKGTTCFRPEHSTIDHCITLRHIIKKVLEKGRSLLLLC